MHVDAIAILLILRSPDALFTKPKLIADIKAPEKQSIQSQPELGCTKYAVSIQNNGRMSIHRKGATYVKDQRGQTFHSANYAR
jgi:hypothetical protein